jgi:hypothetical protein
MHFGQGRSLSDGRFRSHWSGCSLFGLGLLRLRVAVLHHRILVLDDAFGAAWDFDATACADDIRRGNDIEFQDRAYGLVFAFHKAGGGDLNRSHDLG